MRKRHHSTYQMAHTDTSSGNGFPSAKVRRGHVTPDIKVTEMRLEAGFEESDPMHYDDGGNAW